MLKSRLEINRSNTSRGAKVLGKPVESLFSWIKPVCSVERLKYAWAKASENSHRSQQFNRFGCTQIQPVGGVKQECWRREPSTEAVRRGSCCACCPQPSAPSAPGLCQLPSYPLTTHSACLHLVFGGVPHTHPYPHTPLPEKINIWKRVMYNFPAPSSPDASSTITWKI